MTAIPLMPRDLDHRIRVSLNAYFSMMRNERVVRVLHIEVMGAGERITRMHETDLLLAGQMAAFLLRSDNPELELPDDLATSIAFALNGAVNALAVEWMRGGYRLPLDTIVESCSLVVRGTMQALRSRRTGSTGA